ncbi:MAG: acetyl-CoA/propionyl-CoA carboxylase, biotin carboxylase, biotin carboxyl carrier protein [Actinomycetota bacterium]|nr:acetyl-CoA/propionyl-CoA carboxylase, biotin carboxylase, biotin carboxyl carrier protein [Actinomycetota bacterium]
MLTKILIANRGEIAIRVMRTCRELGIPSVAVYSELDRDAAHVRYADEAYALGGQTAAESYLNTEAILDAIRKSGADGVHPGYGFFSENADFARAVTDLGVAWIGPPPGAIEIMGDKISSRLAAIRAEVESVPGTTVPITDASEIVAFGEQFGYPIAIKAAYGGGGRGMKVVERPEDAAAAFDSAAREAQAYFGRPECYLERYLTRPRHVELQIFCDTQGNGVYLSDRDCSTQRRHQKLIEEAPAPAIPDETRRAMGEAAVKVALACGYVNAGTVEMLYQDGEFFFLEMNTRLQVEHCVTEEITGLDLVAEQFRVAAGEPLAFGQDSIEHHGHSIECRINAEDPTKNFLPSPGTITRLRVPSGPGVRWDGGYDEGDTISQFYDNLVGKLIVWAPDRDRAIERMMRALSEFEISGIKTTIPAHLTLLPTEAFRSATHSTKWVEDEVDQTQFAAHVRAAGTLTVAPPDTDGAAAEPLVERTVPVEVDGRRYSVKVWLPDAPARRAPAAGAARARPKRAVTGGSGGAVGSGTVSAPMQGTIVKVLVEVGTEVAIGEPLVVLEAMKMENQINAETAGTVQEIRVAAGDSVGTGDVIAVIA